MIPLEAILIKYDVVYKDGQREQTILCPFHCDTRPSLSLNLAEGLFHCFSCGAGGAAIDFVMKMEGISFADAKRIAEETAGGSSAAVSRSSDTGSPLLPRKSGHRPGRRAFISPWKRNRPGPGS